MTKWRWLIQCICLPYNFLNHLIDILINRSDSFRVRDSEALERAFCVNPLYLRHHRQGDAIDFMVSWLQTTRVAKRASHHLIDNSTMRKMVFLFIKELETYSKNEHIHVKLSSAYLIVKNLIFCHQGPVQADDRWVKLSLPSLYTSVATIIKQACTNRSQSWQRLPFYVPSP